MQKSFKIFTSPATFKLVLVIFVSLLFTGCIKEDYSCNEKGLRTVRIVVIWPDNDKIPEGIRVYFFSQNTKKYTQDNLNTEGGYTDIRDGQYSLLMYNNDSEKIQFRNISQYKSIEAYTSKIGAPSQTSPAPEEEIFDQPDALWVASIDTLIVSDDTKEIRLYPKPVIHRYYGKVDIEGIEHVKQVRGAVTGMKSSMKLVDRSTTAKPVTLYFNGKKDENVITFAWKTFGIIQEDNVQTEKLKHYLILEFLLSHKTIRYEFDITDKADVLPDEGTITINAPIVIPPDTTSGNDDGFQGNVGNWDEILYPIPL